MTALPEPFSELSGFVEKWDLPGTNERYACRLSSSIRELEDFHGALRARLPEIKAYLDGKPFADYTEDDRRLARLVFAWVPVAEAVEVFKQPRVPDSKMYWDVKFEPEV
ncbi:MAG TPA: hypothetical protein VKS60_15220 [Stellaceae bacterium]|nr:hypothetical protein [Stellaceae bacterium]